LPYEVQSVDAEHADKYKPVFRRVCRNIVPAEAEYFYVRAGVAQQITNHLWIPAGILLIRVRAFMLYEQRRIEVSEESDIFEEMFQFRDWTAVDRVFQL